MDMRGPSQHVSVRVDETFLRPETLRSESFLRYEAIVGAARAKNSNEVPEVFVRTTKMPELEMEVPERIEIR